MTSDLISIPCVLMRGGTSKGPFFLGSDLPAVPELRDKVLLAALGSGHALQIDGVGGGHPLTSKVAIVTQSARSDADVEYLFAQVGVEAQVVDTTPNCGNMLAAVGPFAIEMGLVFIDAEQSTALVRIYNVNTRKIIEAHVPVAGGAVRYIGDTTIAGVPGTGAAIALSFVDAVGAVTGELLPTGHTREVVLGVEATLIDYGIPLVLLKADDLGVSGRESPHELDANPDLRAKLKAIRVEADRRMGIHDAEHLVVPKPVLLSAATKGGDLSVRYFMPDHCHTALATTGAIGIAVACVTEGSLAHDFSRSGRVPRKVLIEHPAGVLGVRLRANATSNGIVADVVRTARRLFEGRLFVPPIEQVNVRSPTPETEVAGIVDGAPAPD